jgi:hypothetical protein
MGIIMVKQLRLAAVPLIAGAMLTLTTASGWAFSQQTVGTDGAGNYNFNYGLPDDKAALSNSQKSDSNSSGLHFSIERGQTGPFGFHSFGGSSNATPPDFSRPIGNGD